jgi:hypothetical protein
MDDFVYVGWFFILRNMIFITHNYFRLVKVCMYVKKAFIKDKYLELWVKRTENSWGLTQHVHQCL